MIDFSTDQTTGNDQNKKAGKKINNDSKDSKNSNKDKVKKDKTGEGQKNSAKKGNKKGDKKTDKKGSGYGTGSIAIPGLQDDPDYEKPDITDLLIDYNEKFADALPAKFRDKEIFTVITHLMMSQKCCSLLIGAPGTGKTKIVEDIARNIANKSPYTNSLNDYIVYELPLSNLVSGTGIVGELERKLNLVIQYCENNKVILFMDEIHQLCDNYFSHNNIAQILKPAMARGTIKIIGATTLQESKNLLDDPAFNRRFNRVQVSELSKDQTKDIIEDIYMPKMKTHYGIDFGNGVAERIVKAAEESKTINSHRPDNAITLLDQICANTLLKRNYNLSVCTDDNVSPVLSETPVIVNTTHIDNYIKDNNFPYPDSFDSFKKELFFRDNVIDRAYEIMSDYVRVNELFPEKKPFVVQITGEPCSGKTTFARLIAGAFDEEPVFLDLSDYIDAPSLNRIIGSPVGYIGSNSKKEMPFDIIETNPRKVIILDNMDAASPVVREFFKSSEKTGLIKYADNRIVDISQCIVLEVTTQKNTKAGIGFNSVRPDSGSTELVIEKLTHEEIVAGTEKLIEKMIRELKEDHSRYLSVPDKVVLDDNEKEELISAGDMQKIAKKKILWIIKQ